MATSFLQVSESGSVFTVKFGRIDELFELAGVQAFVEVVQEEIHGAKNIDLSRCLVKWSGRSDRLVMPAPDAPAIEITDMLTGHIYHQHYVNEHGLRDRTDKPALVFDDYVHRWERYFKEEVEHRENGPQDICIAKDTGLPLSEEYRFNGELHRIGGPAIREFSEDTYALEHELYYEHGVQVKPAPTVQDPQP